jgi:hypothetical protein
LFCRLLIMQPPKVAFKSFLSLTLLIKFKTFLARGG